MKSISLGDKKVGDGHPCYVVAEIGGLFQNFDEAKRLIDQAMDIGIDAVKFQTLEAETITTKNNFFDMEATGKVLQYDVFKKFELSKELQKKVVNYANDCGITIFSAPSHLKDLDIMKEMELPIYKIGSDLACHIPLLEEVAAIGKPIILSTGMCTLEDVKYSVETIRTGNNQEIALLHCVSNYPCKIDETNLNAIQTMKNEFEIPVGLSDHNVGSLVSLGAATLGANLIEKHFRHEKNKPSSDDIHAITGSEFKNLIDDIRKIEIAKGNGVKKPTNSEIENMKSNRVSIIVVEDLPKGTILTKEMIDIRRPGTGILPRYYKSVIGKKIKRDVKREEPLTFELID